MDEIKMIKYLEHAKDHYEALAGFMDYEEKNTYSHEHRGKVKFINLLLYRISMGDFDES